MSNADDGDRPATAAELADLRTALDELREAEERRREADTVREREAAAGDAADARADLDAAAKSLGISREVLERAARDAKTATQREELKPILRDVLAELRDEEAAAESQRLADEQAAKDEKKPKSKAKDDKSKDEPPVPDPPIVDDEPTREHWSERTVGNLVK